MVVRLEVAMWRKIMRSHQSLFYRRKYKCPICHEYTVRIVHDFAWGCESRCEFEWLEKLKVEKIVYRDDFDGYYTMKEINDFFIEIDNDEINSIFTKITEDPLLNGMSIKQKNDIEKLALQTINIDDLLDDIAVKYMNKHNIKIFREQTSFSYVVHLIEDIHRFLNLAWNDVCRFFYGSNLVKEGFYTERFFFDNCIDHIFLATERIYVFLGIYYDFRFSSNLSKNRTIRIKQHLKTNSDFKNSKIKNLLDIATGGSIAYEIRGDNIHDLSYLNKKIVNNIQKNSSQIEHYTKDSTEINKLELKPKLSTIIKTIDHYYNVMYEIINMISGNDFNNTNIPMLGIFLDDILNIKPIEIQYTLEFCNNLNMELQDIFNILILRPDKYIIDVFFRINDIIHCITDVFNIEMKQFYDRYSLNPIKNGFISQVDKEYLMYISAIRLYACYDKLGKYLSEIDDRYQNIKYFSDFKSFEFSVKDAYNDKIINIINSDSFKTLEDLRNDIYHSLRPGSMGGETEVQCFNDIIGSAVFENAKMVLDFLKFLIKNGY